MPRAKKATHQPFEGSDPRGAFTKITRDMLTSDAWQDLNLRQQGLYLHLKAKYRQKVSRGIVIETNRDDISMPKSEWSQYYGDYRTFRADMDKLSEVGLLRTIARGQCSRTPNIYGFTDGWKEYRRGPPPKQ